MSLVKDNQFSSVSMVVIALSGAFALIVSVVLMSQGFGAILPHLYYIPIVIATFLYARKGFVFSIMLTAIYLALTIFFFQSADVGQVLAAVIRSAIMIAVAFTIAWLSERRNEMQSALERTQFAVDTSPDEVYFIRLDGHVAYANTTACENLGLDLSTIGTVMTNDINPDITPERWKELWDETKENNHLTFETFHRHADGTIYPVEVSRNYVRIGDEEFSCNFARDITVRKEAEEKIRISEERLRLALDSARMSVWNWDLRDDTLSYDHQFAMLIGCENKDGKGPVEYLRSLVSTDGDDPLLSFTEVSYETDGTVEMDFHMKCADNSWRWIHSAGRPVEYDEDGKVVRVTGIFMDITDLRNSRDSLERTNRKLSLLSGVTRHDVLNQIMGILLLKEYVLGRCVLNDCDVKEDLDLIFSAVETIQHQMEFAGDYQDLGLKEPEWQNVKDLIRSILISRPLGSLNLDADIGNLEIYADNLFEKVLYNLIDNSLRHGKTVTEIRLHFEQQEDYGTLIYEDDGGGIPSDLKESIFERGFGSNTGLGLFLIREILEVTGFTIVESGTEGEGARFEITIPEGMYGFE